MKNRYLNFSNKRFKAGFLAILLISATTVAPAKAGWFSNVFSSFFSANTDNKGPMIAFVAAVFTTAGIGFFLYRYLFKIKKKTGENSDEENTSENAKTTYYNVPGKKPPSIVFTFGTKKLESTLNSEQEDAMTFFASLYCSAIEDFSDPEKIEIKQKCNIKFLGENKIEIRANELNYANVLCLIKNKPGEKTPFSIYYKEDNDDSCEKMTEEDFPNHYSNIGAHFTALQTLNKPQ